ncbi:uncharacterized protein LOC129005498 [Macrosteles quadrilineatus]|uniref:uncharacterized protein LOC129005498 n=1 Tax=Macrosteles quadrilineatus TaxID=74068 RepID=UPI0023E136B9|nr:uncharacterized protein LOC129005498 [Macrosteles quadrilineatus]
MSTSSLCVCCVSAMLLQLQSASAAPFMSTGLRQSLLKTTNVTMETSNNSWNILDENRSANTTDAATVHEVVDMWSVMWYLGAFGGLVTFFLIVTCSEWCFGNHMYTRHGINELYINAYQTNFHEARRVSDSPPPPYDLFAPPSYSDLFGKVQDTRRKSKISVFIIPIHRRQSAPAV